MSVEADQVHPHSFPSSGVSKVGVIPSCWISPSHRQYYDSADSRPPPLDLTHQLTERTLLTRLGWTGLSCSKPDRAHLPLPIPPWKRTLYGHVRNHRWTSAALTVKSTARLLRCKCDDGAGVAPGGTAVRALASSEWLLTPAQPVAPRQRAVACDRPFRHLPG